ncbi:unnamed protein product [Clavelina lepadiformis]|uniref:Uncharacterized protein n=1 Tax=Clavelina lepadiformis TaxID=159417 RepID=A0ABP0FR33_CLALP
MGNVGHHVSHYTIKIDLPKDLAITDRAIRHVAPNAEKHASYEVGDNFETVEMELTIKFKVPKCSSCEGINQQVQEMH